MVHLQESGEMYLETIYLLSKEGKNVRAIDVGEYMGYSKPSVSRAMGILKKGGYVETNEEGYLVLTEEGRRVASKTYERHEVLTKIFVGLGVSEEVASEDACRIEHIISDETFAALKKHVGLE
ncbi:MAG: metal-dependent transcriptional regulator [Lachnospiraceae bacterium]|nr:metal-dependent transcriptional regulator [Lachnospiraceae bacterium]